MKDFFNKCEQTRKKRQICSYLVKISLMKFFRFSRSKIPYQQSLFAFQTAFQEQFQMNLFQLTIKKMLRGC